MKYIFRINSQNQKIKDTILTKTDIVVKVNLHSSSSTNSEMWVIYDDKTNQISYYNNISKDRNHPYRIVVIKDGKGLSCDIFIALLARIRGLISLETDKTNIIGYKTFDKKDSFESSFVGNSFEKPQIVTMPNYMAKDDYSSLMSNTVSKEYNLGILSIEIKDGSSCSRPDWIFGYKYKPYNIPDNESLLGCKIASFVKGIDSLDIKTDLTRWFETNHFDHNIDESFDGREVRPKEYNGLEWGLHFVIIRHGLKTIAVKLDDFLSSIDVNDKIMWNMISNMTDINAGDLIDDSLECDMDSNSFPASIVTDENELAYLPNILDMKPFKFSLCNGQSL